MEREEYEMIIRTIKSSHAHVMENAKALRGKGKQFFKNHSSWEDHGKWLESLCAQINSEAAKMGILVEPFDWRHI